MVLQAQGVSDSFARDACARVPACLPFALLDWQKLLDEQIKETI